MCHFIKLVLFQLCLLAKNVKPALKFLDKDVTEISREVLYEFSVEIMSLNLKLKLLDFMPIYIISHLQQL